LVIVLAAIAVGFFVWQAREQSRWNQYFASLKRQPGFVITGIERRGSSYVVAGLKDPEAPDPAVLLRAAGLDQQKVRHELQPYLSLNTEFAMKRELDAAREQIEKSLIRFDPGSTKLAVAEADRIDSVTAVIVRFLRGRPGSRIAVIGHADETGAPETNDLLSRDRASHVVDALVGQDIPAGALETVSAGNTQPLRAGSTDWDRAANRSVSFRITTQNP
jgi:outer membrane protein OmpA-like peptidoglycan-associated protein